MLPAHAMYDKFMRAHVRTYDTCDAISPPPSPPCSVRARSELRTNNNKAENLTRVVSEWWSLTEQKKHVKHSSSSHSSARNETTPQQQGNVPSFERCMDGCS